MTDRYNALTVVLDTDIRDDDCEPIIAAISMIKGVLIVKPHVADHNSAVAESRVRTELGNKLYNVLYPKRNG